MISSAVTCKGLPSSDAYDALFESLARNDSSLSVLLEESGVTDEKCVVPASNR